MDNNRVLLSNLKAYHKLEKLLKIQEALDSNKIIQKAKANDAKVESCTASNPIIQNEKIDASRFFYMGYGWDVGEKRPRVPPASHYSYNML